MTTQYASTLSAEIIGYAKALFEGISKTTGGLDKFLNDQGITKGEYDSACTQTNVDDFDHFLHYIMSPMSDAMAPAKTDTSYPISDYYVSSSHNTYLWGNQLYGKAKAEAYQNVLEWNCRSVEIDVWDADSDSESDTSSSESEDEDKGNNAGKSHMRRLSRKLKKGMDLFKSHDSESPKASKAPLSKAEVDQRHEARRALKREPRVYHGYTATKDIAFRRVCETIREHAFQTSELPIIVSLEVHTSPSQQQLMVEIMKKEWAPYLVDLQIDANDDISLPILESLRNKILIKVKYSPPGDASKKERKQATKSAPDKMEGESSEEEDQVDAVKKGHIIPELGSMGIFTRSFHFKDFNQPEAKLPTHIFSLSEKKLLDTHKKDAIALFHHNKNYLMRAYPKNTRITSNNLDPAPFWRLGVQLVALNWQYLNEATMLNQAMFASTGGWVLKPKGYRSQDHATTKETALDRGTLDLSIEIFAGQNIGCPPGKRLKAYVRCELHIEDMEETSDDDLLEVGQAKEGQIKARTEALRCEGNPDFRRQVLSFRKVPDVAEELTFVRFKIMDDEMLSRDDMVSWACFRLNRLQPGIRLIHLRDTEGQATKGYLLVRISKSIKLAQ